MEGVGLSHPWAKNLFPLNNVDVNHFSQSGFCRPPHAFSPPHLYYSSAPIFHHLESVQEQRGKADNVKWRYRFHGMAYEQEAEIGQTLCISDRLK